jgi:hypothetical protein
MRAVLFLIREQDQSDGPDGGQIALAQHSAEHKTDLFQLSEAFPRRAIASVAKDVERSRAILHPIRPEHGRSQQSKREDPPEHLLISSQKQKRRPTVAVTPQSKELPAPQNVKRPLICNCRAPYKPLLVAVGARNVDDFESVVPDSEYWVVFTANTLVWFKILKASARKESR